MNSVLDVIQKRRSVRSYSDLKVNRDDIKSIIDAGNLAPTGSNQSWRFVAVTDEERLNEMRTLSKPLYRSFMENMPDGFKEIRKGIDAVSEDPVFYSAPAAIYVIGSGLTQDIDCSMVCQNMMLAAESLGINSCYVFFGQLVLNHPDIKNLIQVGENEKVYGPIILGYGDNEVPFIPQKREAKTDWI